MGGSNGGSTGFSIVLLIKDVVVSILSSFCCIISFFGKFVDNFSNDRRITNVVFVIAVLFDTFIAIYA